MRGLSSLLLSEAELERKSLLLPSSSVPSSCSSLLPPSLYFLHPLVREFISRIHPPPQLGSNPVPRYVATPYRVLNTNRDASFRKFPKTFRTRSLPLMKKSTVHRGLLLASFTISFERFALREHSSFLYLRCFASRFFLLLSMLDLIVFV